MNISFHHFQCVLLSPILRGVDPSDIFLMTWWRVTANCARGCPRSLPQKLENFVFLKLESCNLVNSPRRKFRKGDVLKKKKKKKKKKKRRPLGLTGPIFEFWEKF